MFTEFPRFQKALAPVRVYDLEARRDDGFGPTPWRGVFKGGKPVSAIGPRYTFVDNRELVAAVDILNDRFGLNLTPYAAVDSTRRTRFIFNGGAEFKVLGDPSALYPRLELDNSYIPGSNIRVRAGIFRLDCYNGISRPVETVDYSRRHTGRINPMEFLEPIMAQLDAQFQATRLMAETLVNAPRVRGEIWADIREASAERYRARLDTIEARLIEQVGDNAWASVQAVAELATHNMRGFAAQNWRDRATNLILEASGAGIA
jgi:hypothetical protein